MSRSLPLLVLLALAACRTLGAAEGVLEGIVLKGPLCPGPVRIGHPCPDRPFSALFHVLDPDGKEAARFTSDEKGRFRVTLAPGRYTVVPDPSAHFPESPFNRKAVAIEAGKTTAVELHFDTGMR
jgi:hypothetical protein